MKTTQRISSAIPAPLLLAGGTTESGKQDGCSPAVCRVFGIEQQSARRRRSPSVARRADHANERGTEDDISLPDVQNAIRRVVSKNALPCDQDDLQQDVNVVLINRLRRSDPPPKADLVRYAAGVAKYLCWDLNRSRNRSPVAFCENPERLSESESLEPDPEHSLLVSEARLQLREALEMLSPAVRSAAIMRFIEELPFEEIRTRLRINGPTLAVRLHRAKATLSAALRDRGWPEGTKPADK